MKRGKFIVFEGIDGSGKSTQCHLGARVLSQLSKENHVFMTREPFNTPEIRKRLIRAKKAKDNPRWYLNAFVDDRKTHSDVIKNVLKKGFHCVCDRYDFSTYFYQQSQGITFDEIKRAHKGVLIPDLYLVYICKPKVAFIRRKKQGATTVFDKDMPFLAHVNLLYMNAKKLFPERNIVLINADKGIDSVFKETRKHVNKLFKE